MSEFQESAQLLAGEQLPEIVLEPLIQGVEISGSEIGVINFTPYDACLEKVAVHWQRKRGNEQPVLKTFSIGVNTDAVMFSERVLCNELLQDGAYGLPPSGDTVIIGNFDHHRVVPQYF